MDYYLYSMIYQFVFQVNCVGESDFIRINALKMNKYAEYL